MRRVCALSLPGVRMAAQLSKNGSQHVAQDGKDREECRVERLIFQRGDPQRALPPIGFWDVAPSRKHSIGAPDGCANAIRLG